ncbi:MAG: CPBP family intramembrane metalloprotease [Candidatus Nealsonbacteria bacterium]|nr:CPBP family intramembrane metalloprotease [Candidatus Nealsonbacteria bacterium]
MGNKNTAALWLLYVVVLSGFSIWFFLTGGLNEPTSQLISFFKETRVNRQSISLANLNVLIGFVFINYCVSFAAIIFASIIKKRGPKMQPIDASLKLPFWLMNFILLGVVTMEEVIFRWLPLGFLLPIFDTRSALWILIIVSSLAFGLVHIGNQKLYRKSIIFTLPQMLGGIILCYVFLAFGFLGALLVHFIFNAILFIPLWLAYRVDGNNQSNNQLL